MNVYVSEDAISQIVAIRFCPLPMCFETCALHFRYLGRVLLCAVFPHTPVHHTLRSLFLFSYSFLNQFATTKKPSKHGPTTTYLLALVRPKRVQARLRQGASIGAFRGCLRRVPLNSRGGAGVAASPPPPVHYSGPVLAHDAANSYCTG